MNRELKFTARFQTWMNGERQFANRVFKNKSEVEADQKMAADSFARTEYKEFVLEDEAWAWLEEQRENA
jgi:hypothetical protein